MSNKRVIVLCGVSGVGKTHARLHDPELASLPFVDIADVYRDLDWAESYGATAALATKTCRLLRDHGCVVVEGYFLPGSLTRNLLGHNFGPGTMLEFRLMVEPIEVCRERVISSGENVVSRLKTLDEVWAKSGSMLMRMKREGQTWEPDYE